LTPVPAPLGWPDHLFFLALVVAYPVRAAVFGMRRLQNASEEDLPRVKLSAYRQAIVLQWLFVAALAVLWLAGHRSWSVLGLVPRLTGGLGGVLVGLAITVAVMVRLGALAPGDEAALERLRVRTRHLERMLPTTPRERSWFFALSGTAGVCEEVLYRGFMIWYLVTLAWAFAPDLALLAAAVGSSLLFGAGHAYQGVRGALLTTVVGGFLAVVYLFITRSLFAGMLIHALMDLHAGYLSYLAYRRVRERPETGSPGA
jgi:membrane protease YdiL (CAAX protease family)